MSYCCPVCKIPIQWALKLTLLVVKMLGVWLTQIMLSRPTSSLLTTGTSKWGTLGSVLTSLRALCSCGLAQTHTPHRRWVIDRCFRERWSAYHRTQAHFFAALLAVAILQRVKNRTWTESRWDSMNGLLSTKIIIRIWFIFCAFLTDLSQAQ